MTLEATIAALARVRGYPRFAWSDWKCREYYMWDPEPGFLADVSDAAALGLMLASAEWIHHRFSALDADPMPGYVICAGWAYMLEPLACEYYEPHDDDWRGPIRAPLAVMMAVVMDALFCRDADPEVRVRTHWMRNLANHLLEDDVPAFTDWFATSAARLARVHPHSEMPRLGLFDVPVRFEPVVGRDVFDPRAPYDPATARQALIAYVRAGYPRNPLIDLTELRD
jgi:hypothetical protein